MEGMIEEGHGVLGTLPGPASIHSGPSTDEGLSATHKIKRQVYMSELFRFSAKATLTKKVI